ncbi:MAG TPA: hypothetical protein ENG85_03785 [Bacteroidetes bacterium]|nr:hypothetical protein [Bacteroidota bacterium]
MEWDENTASSEENFIPGIYNYCDRWCERCIYTDRCRTFSMEKEIVEALEEDKQRKKSMEENKQFWNQIDKAVSEAAETYNDLLPNTKEESLSEIKFLFDDEEEDAAEAMKDFKENVRKAENNPLSRAAFKYEKAVTKWFADRKNKLQIEYDRNTKNTGVQYPGIEKELILKQLSDAIDVIQWYQIQMGIKIQRAFTSAYEEETDGGFFEGLPKDSEGSAMVALTGIDRSMGAWNVLYKTLNPEKKSIAPFITLLFLLRAELIKLFPGATTFQWPPES